MPKLVIGAARSGVASANFLAARGESVVITDRDAEPVLPYPLADSVARRFGVNDESLLDDIDEIIVSPGANAGSTAAFAGVSLGLAGDEACGLHTGMSTRMHWHSPPIPRTTRWVWGTMMAGS